VRRLALLIIAALALFMAWLALRDWRPAHWSDRSAAQSAANQLNATLLDRRGPHSWRIRVSGPQRARCLELNVRRFADNPGEGSEGLRRVPCPPP
jgi:hypothetical protein